MKSETQAKLVVAMIVSLVAFGFATSTVMVMGLVANNTPFNQLNVTKQSDFPSITSSRPSGINNTQSQVTSNTENVKLGKPTDTSSNQNKNQNTNSQNQTNSSTSN